MPQKMWSLILTCIVSGVIYIFLFLFLSMENSIILLTTLVQLILLKINLSTMKLRISPFYMDKRDKIRLKKKKNRKEL